MIFFWKGRGVLVLVAMVASYIATAVAGLILGFQDGSPQMGVVAVILSVLACIPVWIYGKKWDVPLELVDKNTGENHTITHPNTFFFIPMQYWAIIYPIFILVAYIVGQNQ